MQANATRVLRRLHSATGPPGCKLQGKLTSSVRSASSECTPLLWLPHLPCSTQIPFGRSRHRAENSWCATMRHFAPASPRLTIRRPDLTFAKTVRRPDAIRVNCIGFGLHQTVARQRTSNGSFQRRTHQAEWLMFSIFRISSNPKSGSSAFRFCAPLPYDRWKNAALPQSRANVGESLGWAQRLLLLSGWVCNGALDTAPSIVNLVMSLWLKEQIW